MVVHASVYANRDRGFDLYEQTEGFPEKLRSKILSVSGEIAATNPADPCTALRFAPLEDRYLFSVIFREPQGNADQARAHHIIVHFLLEGSSADLLLSHPFTAVAERAMELARRIVGLRNCFLPKEWTASLLNPPHPAPPGRILSPERNLLLLMGAAGFWCSHSPLRHQAYIAASETDAVSHIRDVMMRLPLRLRKTLSFHTGLCSAPESREIALNFCSEETLDRLMADGYAGAASSNKYWYRCRDNSMSERITPQLLEAATELDFPDLFYRKLSFSLTDWGQVVAFYRAAREKQLAGALKALDTRVLDQEIRSGRFDTEELKQISGQKGLPGATAARRCLKELGLGQTGPIPLPKTDAPPAKPARKPRRTGKKAHRRTAFLVCALAALLLTVLSLLAMVTLELTGGTLVISVTAGAVKLLIFSGLLSLSSAALGVFLTLLLLSKKP